MKIIIKRETSDFFIGKTVVYGDHQSPVGPMVLALLEGSICGLLFCDKEHGLDKLQASFPDSTIVYSQDETREYAQNVFDDRYPVNLIVAGTDFQFAVWKKALKIPTGRVITYSMLANYCGKPRASRAVGSALGANLIAYIIPCHRIIRKNGGLGGFAYGLACKQALLDWEQSNL